VARTVLVIGGAGRTGRHVVDLLTANGDRVRVMSRRPSRIGRQGVELITGDIADPSAVARAVDGVDAVVVSVEPPTDPAGSETVMHLGVREVAERAASRGAQVVLLSQIYITRPEKMPGLQEMVRARGRGEQALRNSGAPYTIVRPSWLTNEPAGRSAIRLEQGDTGDGQISRADVARACVEALRNPQALGRTFEMYNEPGPAPTDWAALFGALKPDQ